MRFVNLYLQTEYSLLNSTITIDSIINDALKNNIDSLAITDNTCYGVIKFYKKCKENNIKPLIGLRLDYGSTNCHDIILLYAMDYIGYQNIMRISSYKEINGFKDSCHALEMLKKYSNGVLAIIPGMESSVIRAYDNKGFIDEIKAFKNIYKELYVGVDLQTSKSKEAYKTICSLCKSNNIPIVAINKTNFLTIDDFEVYQTLRCIDLGVNHFDHTEKDLNSFLIGENEAISMFKDFSELITNTLVISSKCNLTIPFGEYRFPKYVLADDQKGINFDSSKYLEELAKVGLNKRLQGNKVNLNIYKDRLLYELDVIKKMGFSDYFLIVYDYVKYAKQNKILVGPGRGSAAGSLVSYALGITDLDPIKYNLLFERFLNPERISMPDIDVDFPDDKRDQVINYLGERFGKTRVAHLNTFGTYKARLALRDVARVLQISPTHLNVIMKYIPSFNSPSLESIASGVNDIKRMIAEDESIKLLFYLASKIENLPRHVSTHAAGVVLADSELVNYTALENGIDGIYQTQFEASDIEELGLVKMDILGLRNLTIIDSVCKSINERLHNNFDINRIDENDLNTYKLIAIGNTDGLFQLESRGMRKTLRDLKVSNLMDLAHANALYRPGPADMIPKFVERKNGAKFQYIHKDLEGILKETYGIIVFQEQIMLIAQKFAGYSLGMADILRRAVSKKKADVLQKERIRFVDSAIKNGYSKEISNEIYDYIVKFANYGFNKSHAVAYALIGYKMAYLKVHYYKDFMSALMSNSLGNTVLIANYVNDLLSHGTLALPPDINISANLFVVKDEGIYYPLIGINNLGQVISDKIIEERDKGLFLSYEDYVIRTKEFINKRINNNLAYAGAFDSFGITRKEAVDEYDRILLKASYNKTLQDKIVASDYSNEEYSFEDISFYEKEALGLNIKYNVFYKYNHLIEKYHTIKLADIKNVGSVTTLCKINSVKEIKTKKNDYMAFLELSDSTCNKEAVIFSDKYSEYKNALHNDGVYFMTIQVSLRNDEMQLIVQRVKEILE